MKALFKSATAAGLLLCSALALARTEPGPGPGPEAPKFVPTTLITAPIHGGGFFRCLALNASENPVNIGVSLFQGDGQEVVTTNFCDGAPLEPGQVCFGPSLGTAVGHEASFYCTFSFFGSAGAIRGTLEFTNADGHGLAMEAH